MNDYIAKPFDVKVLLVTISRWLPLAEQVSGEAEAQETQQAEATTDFSAVTTFSSAKGLSMLAGNEALYVKFLQRFLAAHGQDRGKVMVFFEKGELTELQRHAHTVKGHAGQIGADALQAVAQQLEYSVDDGQENLVPLLESFMEHLDLLCKDIEVCLT